MAEKDINIRVKATGVEETKKQFEGVGEAAGKAGEKIKHGGKEGAAGLEGLNQSAKESQSRFSDFTNQIAGWAAGLVGVSTVVKMITSAVREQIAAIKEHADIAMRQQNALTRLQFLGDYYKDKPNLRKEVQAFAEFGRRDFTEVANAWYNLRSKAGGLSESSQMGILRESLEFGRTDPSAPLDMLVDMFSLVAKQSGEGDANKIQNLINRTIREAGGSTADVAKYLPQFLPVAMAGGMGAAEASGLWAYATTQLAESSIATTGLRASFMGLMGKGTPESAKLMKKMGVREGDSFLNKIGVLSGQYNAGRFSLADAESLVGKEGAAVFLSLLANPDALMRTVNSTQSAFRGDIDITGSALSELNKNDEFARLEELDRLLNVAITNVKANDKFAMRQSVEKKYREYANRLTDAPEYGIGWANKAQDIANGLGFESPGGWGEDIDNQSGKFFNILNNNQNVIYNVGGQGYEKEQFTQDR